MGAFTDQLVRLFQANLSGWLSSRWPLADDVRQPAVIVQVRQVASTTSFGLTQWTLLTSKQSRTYSPRRRSLVTRLALTRSDNRILDGVGAPV